MKWSAGRADKHPRLTNTAALFNKTNLTFINGIWHNEKKLGLFLKT